MGRQLTESEWLSSTDPERLLYHLDGRTSPRKLRLIACAGCRLVWHFLPGPARAAVECGERFADGRATAAELEAAWAEALRSRDENEANPIPRTAAWAAAQTASMQPPPRAGPTLVRRMMRRA